ncbi:MAG: hypothetical protein ISS36_02915 [Candidatus Aenigmarchaeota archaeon]|nr:hypothetical protein [Candidatus Aenigmarchaeota archaeon]
MDIAKILLEKAGLDYNPYNKDLLFRAAKEVLGEDLEIKKEPLWLQTISNSKKHHKPKAHIDGSQVWKMLEEKLKTDNKEFEAKIIKLLLSY